MHISRWNCEWECLEKIDAAVTTEYIKYCKKFGWWLIFLTLSSMTDLNIKLVYGISQLIF